MLTAPGQTGLSTVWADRPTDGCQLPVVYGAQSPTARGRSPHVPTTQSATERSTEITNSCISPTMRGCRQRGWWARRHADQLVLGAWSAGGLTVAGRAAGGDEAGFVGVDHDLDAVAEAEFLQDAGDVCFGLLH